ncbi:hypothetical protein TFUB20_01689 [Tannerella forsythia]|uniref:Uncharacterized protein n=1 Tax=Tannerella forsythia TaxID=28112 RepID=A0A1D3UQQ7_TANFO|nr:hypothetical protein TFUB20_01689 [Tannerella forsythia]
MVTIHTHLVGNDFLGCARETNFSLAILFVQFYFY